MAKVWWITSKLLTDDSATEDDVREEVEGLLGDRDTTTSIERIIDVDVTLARIVPTLL